MYLDSPTLEALNWRLMMVAYANQEQQGVMLASVSAPLHTMQFRCKQVAKSERLPIGTEGEYTEGVSVGL